MHLDLAALARRASLSGDFAAITRGLVTYATEQPLKRGHAARRRVVRRHAKMLPDDPGAVAVLASALGDSATSCSSEAASHSIVLRNLDSLKGITPCFSTGSAVVASGVRIKRKYWPRHQRTVGSIVTCSPVLRGNIGGRSTLPVVERRCALGPARSCAAIQTTHTGAAEERLYEAGGNTARLLPGTCSSERFTICNGGSLNSLALEHENTRRLLSGNVDAKK
ncbi:hypothetical protein MRX96_020014 [Rhipicephalus microplus]